MKWSLRDGGGIPASVRDLSPIGCHSAVFRMLLIDLLRRGANRDQRDRKISAP